MREGIGTLIAVGKGFAVACFDCRDSEAAPIYREHVAPNGARCFNCGKELAHPMEDEVVRAA